MMGGRAFRCLVRRMFGVPAAVRKTCQIITLLAISMLAAMAVCGWLPRGPGLGLPEVEPLAKAEFPDGSTVEILMVGEGRVVLGSMTPHVPEPLLVNRAAPVITRTTSDGWWLRPHVTECMAVDGTPRGMTFASGCDGDLTVVLRVTDAEGVPIAGGPCMVEGVLRGESNRLWDTRLRTVMTCGGQVLDDWPAVVLQLRDGEGRRHTADGPSGIAEDGHEYQHFAFHGWPRSGRELVFEVIRPGFPAREMRVPNPVPARPVPEWAFASGVLPQTVVGDGFELLLGRVHLVDLPERPLHLCPDKTFLTLSAGWGFSDSKRDAMDFHLVGLEGAGGTFSKPYDLVAKGRSFGGSCPFPADERMLRLHYQVVRQAWYPRELHTVAVLLEGEVAADGVTLNTKPTGRGRGLLDCTVGNILRDEPGREGEVGLARVRVDCSWYPQDEAEAAALWEVLGGDPGGGFCALMYVDGEQECAGELLMEWGGTSSGPARRDLWCEWSGELEAGQKFKVAVAPVLPPTDVHFVIDPAGLPVRER